MTTLININKTVGNFSELEKFPGVTITYSQYNSVVTWYNILLREIKLYCLKVIQFNNNVANKRGH